MEHKWSNTTVEVTTLSDGVGSFFKFSYIKKCDLLIFTFSDKSSFSVLTRSRAGLFETSIVRDPAFPMMHLKSVAFCSKSHYFCLSQAQIEITLMTSLWHHQGYVLRLTESSIQSQRRLHTMFSQTGLHLKGKMIMVWCLWLQLT